MPVMSAERVAQVAVEKLSRLTGLKPSSLVGVARDEEGVWAVSVEMVEKKSIPESMDVLACYEVKVNADGELLGFSRTRLRKRMDTEQE